jgi:hypothetical protein
MDEGVIDIKQTRVRVSYTKFKNEQNHDEDNKNRLNTHATPVGLFYLIKYLYEEKVCYPELEEEFERLKKIIKR